MSVYEIASRASQTLDRNDGGWQAGLTRARRATGRALREADAAMAAASPYDQSAWAILYGALVNGYGVDPEAFQMVYPYIAWDWPVESLGYIGPGQYDTLSTIPAWSAVGKYTSAGERFNDQYQAFLNVISPNTSDPTLRGEIEVLWNVLVDETNNYDRILQQASRFKIFN